ncbi:XRE family transcriptional regulator [Campylobacter concisus]|uniref:XRE family transcriptional regulator n=1 Tax=Campylobacter concisus TaxID=199 RepID=UPI000D3BDF0B|nr:LexA family transcriptional regulator [Campylobacter concisus]QPH88774.1 transcriptional regulator [Campylobacter concisus]
MAKMFDFKRAKEIMREKGINQNDIVFFLADQGINYTLDGVKNWFRKDEKTRNNPEIKTLRALAELFDTSLDELIIGGSDTLKDLPLDNIVFLSKSEMRVGAGSEGIYDLAMLQKDERKIAVDKAFLKGLDTKNLRIFEVVGDSMEPDFYEGDWAIADMVAGRDKFVRIAGVYIVRMGESVYIKRVEFLPHNGIKLISINTKYGEMYPHKEGYEWEILGKVCGKVHCEVYKGLTFEDYGIK